MKRFLSIVLIATMLLSFASCGQDKPEPQESGKEQSGQEQSEKMEYDIIPPEFYTVEKISDISPDMSSYKVTVSKDFNVDPNSRYICCMGEVGNFVSNIGETVIIMQNGISVDFKKDTIKEHNIPENIFFLNFDICPQVVNGEIDVFDLIDMYGKKFDRQSKSYSEYVAELKEKQSADINNDPELSQQEQGKEQENNNQKQDNPVVAESKAEKTAKMLIQEWGEEYADCVSEDYSKISLPKYASEGLAYSEVAKVYTGKANLSYTTDPKTKAEHWDNIRYAVLTGHWEYTTDITYREAKNSGFWTSAAFDDSSIMDGTRFIGLQEASLLGYFNGGYNNKAHFYFCDGKYYYTLDGIYDINKIPSPQEICMQVIEAYKYIKNKHNDFVASGKITNNSTEYQIAKVYADWYNTIQYDPALNAEWTSGDPNIIQTQSPYGALILLDGKCDGRAAAYQLMMQFEGIKCYPVACGSGGDVGTVGHAIPWVLLDGEEYAYEHNMKAGLMPVDRATGVASVVLKDGHTLVKDSMQLFHYHSALKRAGLPYDEEMLKKYWRDEIGTPMTKEEFENSHK